MRQTYYKLRYRFGRTQLDSQITGLKWKLDSICLDIVLILMKDRCTVCVERTIDLKIILDAPDGTPW
jgi:hypothetical protein